MSLALPGVRSHTGLHARITLVKGDITRQPDVDAIFSTLPMNLRLNGGLNRALFAAAGPRLDQMVLEEVFRPQVGDSYIFPACDLAAPFIIFTITENWDAGVGVLDRDILRAYRRGIEAAQHKGIRRLAVPALHTGQHKFPPKRAARLAIQAILDRLTPAMDEVRVVCDRDDTYDAFQERLAGAA